MFTFNRLRVVGRQWRYKATIHALLACCLLATVLGGFTLAVYADSPPIFLGKWGNTGSGEGQFLDPRGVAVDSNDNIYVVERRNQRVQKFDSTGTFLLLWGTSGSGTGQFNNPVGVTVDSNDNVYVVGQGNHRIQKFTSTGTFLTTWGSFGSSNGEFNAPWDIAVDSSDNVYVADTFNHRIQKFDNTGNFLTTWGSLGSANGQFNEPRGVAVDSSDNIYIADQNNNRIQKFDSAGNFLATFGTYGTGDGQFDRPLDMVVDSNGNIFVADTQNNRIQKVDSAGNFLTKWGSFGRGDGQFEYPGNLALDSVGNLYISENLDRIQKFGTPSPEIDVQGNGMSIVSGDSTPTSTDDTDFGSADLNTEVVYHTFTIKNTGDAPLNLSGNPVVAVSGHVFDFIVTSQPATPIAAGGESTFTVVFNPYDLGTRTATISVANNDSNENPYTFAVQGVGITTAPEIDVQGNGMSIASGDSTPSTADHTDFDSVNVSGSTLVRTFTIRNTGDGALNLTGSPAVAVSGDHASEFFIIIPPATAIEAGGESTFQVMFNPAAPGIRTATIAIANNDGDENPYTFTIQGTGTEVVCSATMSAATTSELNDAIGCFNNQSTPGTYTINIAANITLNATTTEISNTNSGVKLQINGNGNALDGDNAYRGLAIAADTWAMLDRLTIRNSAVRGGSGGITNLGILAITNSTISNNAGGIDNDAFATLMVSSSTFHNNTAVGSGAAISNFYGTATVSNSTFSANSAGGSGGAIYSNGILTVHNSTFSNNTANTGGGLYNEGTLTLNNTIVANSTAGGDCVNAGSGAVTSQTNNLIEDSTNACGISHGTNGTIVGQDPLLGPLQDNGGPAAGAGTTTHTHALLAGSPALDGGDNATCAAAPVNNLDQRGTVRPQGAACDIGSVERDTANLGATNKVSQDGVTTSYNPTPTTCANLDLPIHTINSTLRNSSSDNFSDLYFVLTALDYTAPQGEYHPTLCNADGGNGGRAAARLTLPLNGDLADNLFTPSESTTFTLDVGLPVRKRYRILGSLFGSPVNNNELVLAAETVQAGEVTTVQQLGIFVWEFDDEGNLVDSSVQIFLPLVVR